MHRCPATSTSISPQSCCNWYRHLALGVAGWMRYVSGTDELLAIESIFGDHLTKQQGFVDAVKRAYQRLLDAGARQAVAAL